jgi:ectoine hydroxylase-related dioxygenase (phytanoyl-CoA dioxygenase family)
MAANNIPENSYGVLEQNQGDTHIEMVAEQVRNLGYSVLDSGYTASELSGISEEFNRVRKEYIAAYGASTLKGINEYHTIRALLTHGGDVFLNLALNAKLLSLIKRLIQGKFILNQQNGVINPPQENYNQGAWHRDLPYQHFVSTKPLAINALFCVDDFTRENGATFVIPASQKSESFPSKDYIRNNAIQVDAKAGSYIVLDCMLFHAGGFNQTQHERRGVNHVFNIPYFKQQINLPANMRERNLSPETKELLGFPFCESGSILAYLSERR